MTQGRLFPVADGPAVTCPNLVPLFRKFVASRPPALEGDRAAGPPRPAAQPLNEAQT